MHGVPLGNTRKTKNDMNKAIGVTVISVISVISVKKQAHFLALWERVCLIVLGIAGGRVDGTTLASCPQHRRATVYPWPQAFGVASARAGCAAKTSWICAVFRYDNVLCPPWFSNLFWATK